MSSGNSANAKRRIKNLKPRDRKILDFIYRYRLGTPNLIATAYCPQDSGSQNAMRILRRLVGKGLLVESKIHGRFVYFQISRSGQRVLKVEPRSSRPFTEDSFPNVWAVAAYCVASRLRCLTNREFRKHFPELTRPGLRSSSYCIDSSETESFIRMLMIDRGGSVRRVRSKVFRVLKQRSSLPSFVALIKAGRFEVTFLTGLANRETKLNLEIEKSDFRPVRVSTYLLPELGQMLTLGGSKS